MHKEKFEPEYIISLEDVFYKIVDGEAEMLPISESQRLSDVHFHLAKGLIQAKTNGYLPDALFQLTESEKECIKRLEETDDIDAVYRLVAIQRNRLELGAGNRQHFEHVCNSAIDMYLKNLKGVQHVSYMTATCVRLAELYFLIGEHDISEDFWGEALACDKLGQETKGLESRLPRKL